MKHLVTVVIPCKNEGRGILDVLDSLSNQVNCKVIIADSSTEKESISLLKDYQLSHSNINIINGGLPAIARNNGAQLVSTPYVLFLDADTYFIKEHTLSNCLELMLVHDYDLITCKFKTDKKYNWIYRVFDLAQWLSSKTKPFCLGGFMLFKTETFENLKGFNEKDKIAEDYHISSKIKPRKFKIFNDYVYTPSRRFQKKGIWYMIKLALDAYINRNNDSWFEKDYNYFS